jgi:hypothetical protein
MRQLFHLRPVISRLWKFPDFFVCLHSPAVCDKHLGQMTGPHTQKSRTSHVSSVAPSHVNCSARNQLVAVCFRNEIRSGRIIGGFRRRLRSCDNRRKNIRRDFFVNYCPSNDRTDYFQSAAVRLPNSSISIQFVHKIRPDGR